MIKFYCDICKKEIQKENNLFGNFTYFTRKMDLGRPENKTVQVEMALCEGCTDGMKRYIEGQININK